MIRMHSIATHKELLLVNLARSTVLQQKKRPKNFNTTMLLHQHDRQFIAITNLYFELRKSNVTYLMYEGDFLKRQSMCFTSYVLS